MSPEPTEALTEKQNGHQSALLDLVRSGVELNGPQRHPTPEVARLAFHLERIAAELAATREALAHKQGELEVSGRIESQLQKYVDRFEEKSSSRIKDLEMKLEDMSRKFTKANLQIAELKTALEIATVRNKQLEDRVHQAQPAPPRKFFERILHPHAQA